MPCPACCTHKHAAGTARIAFSFYNTEGDPKHIECIRVDGASNEGPSQEEVQYWWTERHLAQAKVVTLVTTRSSGSSYLIRVELQNSCLARAHSNLFIPSTLYGSPISNETGKIDYDVLHKNLSTAIDVHIQRCNHAPIGLTEINLYRGAKFDLNKRENLLVYLKGSKNERRKLQEENPEHYAHFEKVWRVRACHLVPGLPSQYIFFLRCCYLPDCPHPVCQDGIQVVTTDFLLLPVPDSSRPWGASNCPDRNQNCSGHFLKPDKHLINIKEAAVKMSKPPSSVIKDFLQSHNRSPSERHLLNLFCFQRKK